MRTSKNDNNSFAPYKENPEVELVVLQSYMDYVQIRIDRALDDGAWESNPSGFQKLVDMYLEHKKIFNEFKKSLDKSL